MLLSRGETRRIARRLIGRSQAESCIVRIAGGDQRNLRFAKGGSTTNGATESVEVTIESHFGRRSGAASASGLDETMLDEALARSERVARLAPEDPEFLPPLGPQDYARGHGYDAETAGTETLALAKTIAPVMDEARARAINISGYTAVGRQFFSVATSAGLQAYERRTASSLTLTARNAAGTWSGWAGNADIRFDDRLGPALGRRALDKASFRDEPVRLDPGKYTVLLEPQAVADLLQWMMWHMGARWADEGRSAFSRPGGGNKIGETLFSEAVTISSDPDDPLAPEAVFNDEGLSRRRTPWVEKGVLKTLVYPRYWAQQTGHAPVPAPRSFAMTGGGATRDEMIAGIARGVLVTRFWYIRMVDPRTLLLTGLTRDGTFLIENGRIAAPARNFRFNESPMAVLKNMLAAGPAETAIGGEEGAVVAVPPLLVKDFTFSSISDAI